MAILQLADNSATPPPTDGDFSEVANGRLTHIDSNFSSPRTRTVAAGLSRAKAERQTLKPKVLESKLNSSGQINLR